MSIAIDRAEEAGEGLAGGRGAGVNRE